MSILTLCSRFLGASVLVLAACGGGDTPNPGADAADVDQPDGEVGGGFTELITGTWSKDPGSDSYWCSYKTLTEDLYITGFEAVAPLGTHHTVLGIATSYNGPDKQEACGVQTVGEQLLYASGVGTDTYSLPEGVALKVSAGETLLLQLHLYNASDAQLTGTSGTDVTTTTEAEVQDLAEFFFAGTLNFQIPGDGTDHTANGTCTMSQDGTIFTLWPHMHQVGKHMKIDLNGTNVLHDQSYSFSEQVMYPREPLAVKAGDKINVECTWNNPVGNATKGFGDGSDDEMCFGGIYRYPAVGSTFNFGFCMQ